MTQKTFRLHSLPSIISRLKAKKRSQPVPLAAREIAGADYRELFGYAPLEVASSFRFLAADEATKENTLRDHPLCGLAVDWWAFANDGSGNLWVLRRRSKATSEVGFVDHDRGPRARVDELGITLKQWFRLGELAGQLDRLMDHDSGAFTKKWSLREPYRTEFISEMDRLSKGLSERYPFTV